MLIDIECKICGNKKNNTYLEVIEMMLQLNDNFKYLNCYKCGCLSLMDIPKDMSKYYPSNYYSYNHKESNNEKFKKIKNLIRKRAMKGRLGSKNIIDLTISKVKNISYSWLKKDLMRLNSKILDVGCGNGFLIKDMQNFGFTNLIGIDPYIIEPIKIDNIKIYKSDIYSLRDDNYDFIMYHHSFEHILDPHKELQTIYNKLNNNGILLIRIPLCDSYAFRKYKQNWVQLDAPRHFFIHTRRSMYELSKKNNFMIESIIYDSTGFQFTGSECYLSRLSIDKSSQIFTKKQLKFFNEKSKELNLLHDGDSACFYLKKVLV